MREEESEAAASDAHTAVLQQQKELAHQTLAMKRAIGRLVGGICALAIAIGPFGQLRFTLRADDAAAKQAAAKQAEIELDRAVGEEVFP